MDVDRVKGKMKGKQKGKSKGGKDSKGKGKWKDGGKNKGKDYKGKSKSYGKSTDGAQGKGKGVPADTCKLCGNKGHWSRECPVRTLRQVSQDGQSTAASQSLVSGSSGQQGVQGSPSTTVRRITYFDLDDVPVVEEPYVRMVTVENAAQDKSDIPEYDNFTNAAQNNLDASEYESFSNASQDKLGVAEYDMTYSDSDEDWHMCDDEEVKNCGKIHFENFVDASVETFGKSGTDGGSSLPGASVFAEDGSRPSAFVRGIQVEDEVPIILDSGADMSVLPMRYRGTGKSLSQKSILRDAQGNLMPGGALRKAVIEIEDDHGNVAKLTETFALSSVAEPLVALGKLLKKGWKVEGDGAEVKLACGVSKQQFVYGGKDPDDRGASSNLSSSSHHELRGHDDEPDHHTGVAFVVGSKSPFLGGDEFDETS